MWIRAPYLSSPLPHDKKEFVQQLAHHYYAPYDNITSLQTWQSDILCRAITGDGITKRELYSDDEDFIYKYRRCIGLNGINVVATKPDLLDRSVLIGLERIPRNKRIPEAKFWAALEKVQGEILGGIFTAVSRAMALYPSIELDEYPRMADFAVWGCAIAEALGYGMDAFLDAYDANIRAQNREALEGSIIGDLILKFMGDRTEWQGTPSELLIELELLGEACRVNTKAQGFPKAANTLTRRLNEIKTNLLEEGIIFVAIRDAQQRTIQLSRSPLQTADNTVIPSLPSFPRAGDNDGIDDGTKNEKNSIVIHEGGTRDVTTPKIVSSLVSSSRKQEPATHHDGMTVMTILSKVSKGEPSQIDKLKLARNRILRDYGYQPINANAMEEEVRYFIGDMWREHKLTMSHEEAELLIKAAITDRDRGR
ncbi:hypothetical protein ANME2D_00716 [Candidatus Methanoperedens nitroreducens]|uniref:Uncharacterized protein n=1 Tax=Candidatus Methanoperedens nitratireducens TaxID=1392998 RepID=A0A062VDA3_9EURY|nr:hypothetical protein ANME2D_00716 [Candidatus Methanoperedens nitroreducens]MDJ1422396.1 hypothetical protein [Candidatus Methanoperedens sp.]